MRAHFCHAGRSVAESKDLSENGTPAHVWSVWPTFHRNALQYRVREVSAYAPGRVELLGNHTDYNEGLALAAAIDRGIWVKGSAREDRRIAIESIPFARQAEISLDELRPQTRERWANYALGVVQEFLRAGYPIQGFDARVSGDLPVGVGVSSSAAFEVATSFFLTRLHNLNISPMAVAKLCQRAENDFVGVRSGLLDQATSIFGREHHAVFLDFRNEAIDTIPFPENCALIISDSGEKHSLIASEYNARREECAAAAYALRAQSLRDVTLAQVLAAKSEIDPLLFHRAMHIVGENDRVSRAVGALRKGDAREIGNLMYESHESSRVHFENTTPQLDRLIEMARKLSGVLGSRLTGGGFGGGTVTLAQEDEAARVATEINRQYAQAVGRSANAIVCKIANGALICNA